MRGGRVEPAMRRGTRFAAAGGSLVALALLASSAPAPTPFERGNAGTSMVPVSLAYFDSCADALTELRAAATAAVGPYGFAGEAMLLGDRAALSAESGARTFADAQSTAGGPAPGAQHSTTNNHETGVDEPDLVKTDGRRIVTATAGMLRVVDPSRPPAHRETRPDRWPRGVALGRAPAPAAR